MTNEKQNEVAHWINKLTELDALPEAASDKDALWQHLHERLQQKPKRKKTIWYWAAACLLLLIALPLLLKQRTPNTIVKNIVQQKENSAPPLVINKEQLPVISITANNKTTTLPHVKENNPPKNTAYIPKAAYSLPARIIEPGTTAAIIPVPLPDTAVAIIATVPDKKKLPVVHINELGKQEQEEAPFASHNQRSSFQIKIFNQDSYPGTPLPANNTATDMLKIKIPLKN